MVAHGWFCIGNVVIFILSACEVVAMDTIAIVMEMVVTMAMVAVVNMVVAMETIDVAMVILVAMDMMVAREVIGRIIRRALVALFRPWTVSVRAVVTVSADITEVRWFVAGVPPRLVHAVAASGACQVTRLYRVVLPLVT